MSSAAATNGHAADPALSKSSIEAKAAAQATPNAPATAWDGPGPAASDFRSDIVTTPTASMLASIAATTLLDDVFAEDPTTSSLEAYIADMLGHEAGLLVPSGTMGNQLAIRAHLARPPHAILCDARSHIYAWEAGGLASLSGALAQPIAPANTHHLTLADIESHAVTSDDVHAAPTRLIALENTLGGTILPLSDCQAIAAWSRALPDPIPLHLDGARLWEASAAGAGSLRDYAACFDSANLCFSKGLGAPIGSILTGTHAFIKRARHIRKAIGGGMRQTGVIAAPARVAVDETFLGGRLARTHEVARRVAAAWLSRGGKLAMPVETNMVWLDLAAAGVGVEAFVRAAGDEGVRVMGGRVVCHFQISDEAVAALERAFERVMEGDGVRVRGDEVDDRGVGREATRMKLNVE